MDENTEAALMRAGAQIELLQRRVEALRRDAERYRWLRDMAYPAVAVQLMQHMPGEMDGAIDHAMQMDGVKCHSLGA